MVMIYDKPLHEPCQYRLMQSPPKAYDEDAVSSAISSVISEDRSESRRKAAFGPSADVLFPDIEKSEPQRDLQADPETGALMAAVMRHCAPVLAVSVLIAVLVMKSVPVI